ncbi:MAG: amidase [Leptospiraceae bacterium]|nr:amidase [Leptospiraceae bacterium]
MISAFCNDIMGKKDAVELAKLISKKEIKAEEILEASIQRAEKVNPFLNAIITKTYDLARKNSKTPSEGFFSGIPTFIKDNEDVMGVPTSYGSLAVHKSEAKKNSKLVQQMSALGFVTLGKSALCEFGLTATTESLLNGSTRNPWNTEHSTGGSSGGAAALVASGVVPIAHANDGGGSIRIPAACCGLVGLKPSRDRLMREDALSSLPVNIVCQGVVSRTVRDTAQFYFEAEKFYQNKKLPPIGLVEHPSQRRLKIGFFKSIPFNKPVHLEVVATVDRTAKLCENLKHSVEEIPCPFGKQVGDDFFLYWGMLAFLFSHMGGLIVDNKFNNEKLEYWTKEIGKHYFKHIFKSPILFHRLRHFFGEYEKLFQNFDVILCPTIAHPAPKIGYLSTTDVEFHLAYERLKEFVPFTPIHNISGGPAISLPLGMSKEGLPLGMQFFASLGQDKTLLELAFELEQAANWV